MSEKRSRRVGCSPVILPEKPLLSELAGMAELRAWGEAFIEDVFAYRHGHIGWKDVDPGVVVHGPPGTGKSTFARALSATSALPLIAASYANWQRSGEGHLGDVLSAMARDFEAAFARAPCILAIDELDSLPSRESNSDKQIWWTPVVNALLEQLSGAVERDGIAVIGICNDIRKLDPALIRAGRLDRQIFVPLPDKDEIPRILRFHLTESEAEGVGDLSWLGLPCMGMTGADLSKLVRDARRIARQARRGLLESDLRNVLEPVRRNPEEDRRVAIHEAGHAVAAVRLHHSSGLTISIMRRPGQAGRTMIASTDELATREVMQRSLVILLAGRAAEDVVLGSISGGSGGGPISDLGVATRLALDAVANHGLGATMSPVWYGASVGDGPLMRHDAPLSIEVNSLLNAMYGRARSLIDANREAVTRVADALIARRCLSETEILELCGWR